MDAQFNINCRCITVTVLEIDTQIAEVFNTIMDSLVESDGK